MIRSIMKRDLVQLKDIHEKFYSNEFPISDLAGLACAFCVVDEFDRVVTAGGVRTIVEAVIVTDKDVDVEHRRFALLEMMKTATDTTRAMGYDQLHAFVQDEKWQRHLIKYGFKPTIGKSLVTRI